MYTGTSYLRIYTGWSHVLHRLTFILYRHKLCRKFIQADSRIYTGWPLFYTGTSYLGIYTGWSLDLNKLIPKFILKFIQADFMMYTGWPLFYTGTSNLEVYTGWSLDLYKLIPKFTQAQVLNLPCPTYLIQLNLI